MLVKKIITIICFIYVPNAFILDNNHRVTDTGYSRMFDYIHLLFRYASAKKCSNEGRALMQLDFQQFLLKLEQLTSLRPIPGREYVEGYIKAFYLPEAQLESWLREHKVCISSLSLNH